MIKVKNRTHRAFGRVGERNSGEASRQKQELLQRLEQDSACAVCDARDILIDQVRRGNLSPEAAETEAAKQGFGPLATEPDPLELDPEGMAWWSLPLAVAWIAWRNGTSVREHCAEYRDKWLVWIPGWWTYQPRRN